MSKKYIVTGGAGFIGSHVVEALLARGDSVIVVDNLSAGKREYLPDNPNLTFVEVDIGDWEALSRKFYYFKDVYGVFHLAAQARIQPSIYDPSETHNSNITGTMHVLEMMKMLGIQNIVYSASSSYYGLKNTSPLKEDMPSDCLNPYSLAKYVGELYCKTWGKLYGVKSVCLRYFNVYGRRSPVVGQYAPVLGLWFRHVLCDKKKYTVIGDGDQRRDFTHVSDVVAANLAAMRYVAYADGLSLNVGTGTNYSLNELGQLFEEVLRSHGIMTTSNHTPPRPGEARETLADCTLTQKTIQWTAKTDIKDGLEDLWNYYTDQKFRW